MPKFHVSKSVTIAAPPEEVFASVRDFRQWREWSPWLIAEPDCNLSYAADGTSYTWDGRIVGSGELAVVDEQPPEHIGCRLTFRAPMKSENKTAFLFAAKDGGTEVIWTMEGSLPFWLFFFKAMMAAFVGNDYQRGLDMLKAKLETGSVPSKVEFLGTKQIDGFSYLGVRSQCATADLGSSMERDMQKLGTWMQEHGGGGTGPPFSIYHKWDMVKGRADYTIAVPVENPPSPAPAGFATGAIPKCATYQVRHTGPYGFLGNAWSSAFMHARARSRIFEQDKSIPHFEVYENDPTEVPENELVTVVHFPVKGPV